MMGQGAAGVWGTRRARLGGNRGCKGGGGSHREKAGKGRGEPSGPPHTPHPSPPPGFPIWAGAACQKWPHVCARGGGVVTGARRRGDKSRKGPGARPGAAGRLTRGLRGRRPARPARPRLSGRGPAGQRRGKGGAPARARSRGRRARLPLPVSGPHCRG